MSNKTEPTPKPPIPDTKPRTRKQPAGTSMAALLDGATAITKPGCRLAELVGRPWDAERFQATEVFLLTRDALRAKSVDVDDIALAYLLFK